MTTSPISPAASSWLLVSIVATSGPAAMPTVPGLRALGGREVPPGIILGKELSRLLTAYPGDEVYIVSPFGGSLTPIGGRIPYMKKFKVAGLFDSGMYDYDTSFAYVSIESAQKLLRLGQSVHGIEVKVDDIYSVDKISRSVLESLGSAYWTQDWMQMNKNFFSEGIADMASSIINACQSGSSDRSSIDNVENLKQFHHLVL